MMPGTRLKFLRPFGPAMTAPRWGDALRAGGGAAVGLLICEAILHLAAPGMATGQFLLIAPFGATAFLIFVVPNSPLAQPWSAVVGNGVAALSALAVLTITDDPVIAAPLATLLAILAMAAMRAFHPPAGAVALATVLASRAPDFPGSVFALSPVLAGTVALVAAGILWNRATGRVYPFRQPPAPDHKPGPAPRDLAALLDRLRLAPNIGVGDLARLLADSDAATRHLGDLTAKDIMSRHLVTARADTAFSELGHLFRQHRFKTLPLTDAAGRYLGLVDQSALLGLIDPALTAADLATAAPSLPPDATVAEVLDHLAEGHPQAVPITEDGRLIGLVTRSDLIALLAARLRDG
ncbi:MAG: HPP family protein [Fuscovulum sp.]|nr:MAG: HPP family protein [Fuscovulum sp.]